MTNRRRTYGALLIGIATLGLVVAGYTPASANHTPANKAAVSGSTFEEMETLMMEGAASREAELLSAVVKTTKVSDLALQVTLECALWTDTTVIGNDESSAVATVTVWIEDETGAAVPVAGDDDGRVVFCNRAHSVSVTDLDDEDANLTQFLRTRAANAFNWFIVDVGQGVHTYTVFAQLEVQVDNLGTAHAGIGKRTMIVEPIHLANHA